MSDYLTKYGFTVYDTSTGREIVKMYDIESIQSQVF